MHNLRLSRYMQDFVEGNEDTELLVFPRAFKLESEFLEDVVRLLRVFLQVLKQLDGSLFLDLDVLTL